MLMRRAVVAFRQRRALTGLALAGRRVAVSDAAFERSGSDLLLDELDRGADALCDRPGDFCLHSDWKVAADVLEEGPVRLCKVVRIRSQPLHRRLARREHFAP